MKDTALALHDEYEQLYFGPDKAPFGELSILATKDISDSNSPNRAHSRVRTILGVEALFLTDRALKGSEFIRSTGQNDANTLGKLVPLAVEASIHAGLAGIYPRQQAVYAVTHPTKPLVQRDQQGLRNQYLTWSDLRGNIIGFAGSNELYRGSSKTSVGFQMLFRSRRLRSETHISSVAVASYRQNKGIGVALFDRLLAQIQADRPVRVKVPSAASRLVNRLESVGFAVQSVEQSTEYMASSQTIEVTDLEAASTRDVREKLAEQYPWLAHAEVVSDEATS